MPGTAETEKLAAAVGELYGRKTPLFRWPFQDQQNLAEIARRPDVIEELNTLRDFKGRYKFFPHTLSTLLGKWEQTLDAARNPHVEKAKDKTKTDLQRDVERTLKAALKEAQ